MTKCVLSLVDEGLQKAEDELLALLAYLDDQPECKQSDRAREAAESVSGIIEGLKEKQAEICEYRNELFQICSRTETALEKEPDWRDHPDPYGLHGIEYSPPTARELNLAAIDGVREIRDILKGEM